MSNSALAEGAEEDFLRIDSAMKTGSTPSICTSLSLNERARPIVVADGNGKIKFGHGKPG